MAGHRLTDSDIDSLLSDSMNDLSDIIAVVATSNNYCPTFARQVVYSRMDYLDAEAQREEILQDAIDGRALPDEDYRDMDARR